MEKQTVLDILEDAYFGANSDEEYELSHLGDLLGKTDLFLDLGASLGPYTRKANSLLNDAVLVAVEADPLRAERLREIAETWRSESGNRIEVVECAVADTNGHSTFLTTDSNISGALRPISGRTDNANSIEVVLRTLDDLVAEHGADAKQIFIKVDVEGAEFLVLEGAREVLRGNREVDFLIEMHSWGDSQRLRYPSHCFSLMRDAGYHVQIFGEHYHFSRDIPPDRRLSYARAIAFWRTKTLLRGFTLLRALNRFQKSLRGRK